MGAWLRQEMVPVDVQHAVKAYAIKLDLSLEEVVAYFVREGIRKVHNPAPWNVSEQEKLASSREDDLRLAASLPKGIPFDGRSSPD